MYTAAIAQCFRATRPSILTTSAFVALFVGDRLGEGVAYASFSSLAPSSAVGEVCTVDRGDGGCEEDGSGGGACSIHVGVDVLIYECDVFSCNGFDR